jgi:hypothetical protein
MPQGSLKVQLAPALAAGPLSAAPISPSGIGIDFNNPIFVNFHGAMHYAT